MAGTTTLQSAAEEEQEQGKQQKQKRTRSRISCNVCRVKRRKCDGTAPDPCSQCTAAGAECTWAVERKRGPPSTRPLLRQNEKLEEHLLLLWLKIPDLCLLSAEIAKVQHEETPNLASIPIPNSLLSAAASPQAGNQSDDNNLSIDLRARYDSLLQAIFGRDDGEGGENQTAQTRQTSIMTRLGLADQSSPSNNNQGAHIDTSVPVASGSGSHVIAQNDPPIDLSNTDVAINHNQLGLHRIEALGDSQQHPNQPDYGWNNDISDIFENLNWATTLPPQAQASDATATVAKDIFAHLGKTPAFSPPRASTSYNTQLGRTALKRADVPTHSPSAGQSNPLLSPRKADLTYEKSVWETSSSGHTGYFFGKTSGKYCHSQALPYNETALPVPNGYQQVMASIDGNTRSEISDIYLTYIHIYLPMLYKNQILRWAAMSPSTDITPALLCAVLAVTAPYARPGESSVPIPGVALEKMSLDILESISEVANLQNVQAYILLAMHAWNQGDENKARRRTALAVSTALDLGLHCLHIRHPTHPQRESIIRTWHCMSNLDTLLSFHLGRPPLLRGDWTVPEVSLEGNDEWEVWKPESALQLLADYQINPQSQMLPSRARPGRTLWTFRLLTRLCSYGRRLMGDLDADGMGNKLAASFKQEFESEAEYYAYEKETQSGSCTQHLLDVRCMQMLFELVSERESTSTPLVNAAARLREVSGILEKRLQSYTFLRSPFLSLLLPLALKHSALGAGHPPGQAVDTQTSQAAITQFSAIHPNVARFLTNAPKQQAASALHRSSISSSGPPCTTLPTKRSFPAITEPNQLDQSSRALSGPFRDEPSWPNKEMRAGPATDHILDPTLGWPYQQSSLPSDQSQPSLGNFPAWQEGNILASLGLLTTPGASLNPLPDDAASIATMISAWNAGALYQGTSGS